MALLSTAHGPNGYQPASTSPVLVWNRTGQPIVVGEVYMLDVLATVDAATTTLAPGDEGSGFNNIVDTADGQDRGIMVCVVGLGPVGTGANDTQVYVQSKGRVQISVRALTTDVVRGTPLATYGTTDAGTLYNSTTAGHKVVALWDDDDVTGTTTPGTLGSGFAIFNGEEGFGTM